MAKNLAEATREEVDHFVGSFDSVLFDCDGVILLGEELIPNVAESIEQLRAEGKRMRLITNNCFRTVTEWDDILKRHSLGFTSEDVIFPTRAVISYLNDRRFTKKAFVLGHPAISEELSANGIEIYDYKYKGKMRHISEVGDNVKDDLSVGAVIVDLDFDLTYMKLMKAATMLKRKDVHFIFCATDKTAPLGDNLKIIGSHFIGETLEMMSGRKPVILGKPGKMYNNFVRKFYNCEPGRTLFVGDSLLTDMLFATRCGYQKLLVLTGTTCRQDMLDCPKNFAPNWYLNSLGDLHGIINRK